MTAPEPLNEAAVRLAAIVESSDDAIVSKSLQGIVTSWNRSAERIFGYTAAEMIGQPISRIIPEDRAHEEDTVLAQIRRGGRVEHFETVRRRKDGSPVSISLSISPIFDTEGKVIGASKIARDITERKLAEEERARLVAASLEQERVTQKLNRVGSDVASTLDRAAILQIVVDASREGTGAESGAFFYHAIDPQTGRSELLSTLSGDATNAFAQIPNPEATLLVWPSLARAGIVRVADVTEDPGWNASVNSLLEVPLRSLLAVPVKSASGGVIGRMLIGHSRAGAFTPVHEQLVAGIAAWASVALENARLYVNAQEANRLKDEFLATLSHELRTPLNAILGYIRMIRVGLLSGDRQARAVETVERNATSLTQIIEDVLDVSRIISGKIRLDVLPVNLSTVIRDALESIQPAADAKGIAIDLMLDGGKALVAGDAGRLQQIVWNLVSNAVKFTPRDGRVQVRVECAGSYVEVVVSDTGIGIPPAFLPHVFERFRQADAGVTRERGGLGLGLAIARHLVELHGGSLEASSRGEGHGSTFRMTLPMMTVHGVDRRAPGGETLTARRAEPGPSYADLHAVRVLVVDDDEDALMMVREILEASGANVITAQSAAEALSLVEAVEADVLLADLSMPRMSGFELIREIRQSKRPAWRDIPAAALTAFARSEDRARALRSGFQLHLAKPIDPAELVAVVSGLSGRHPS